MASHMEANHAEDMKVVIYAFYDTFIKYLQPKVILNKCSIFDSHKDEILEDQSSRETVVCNLLSIAFEDDTTLQQFVKTLQEIADDQDFAQGTHIFTGTDDEKLQLSFCLKHLIVASDRSMLRKLSRDDMDALLDLFLGKKIISMKSCKELKEIEDPVACYIKILQSVNRGKPGWPFIFFKAISERRPELLQSSVIAEMAACSSISTLPEKELHIGELQEDFGDFMPEYSLFSQVSEHQQSETGKLHLTPAEKDSLPWAMLRYIGNMDDKFITTDAPPENTHNHVHNQRTDFSDGDDDDDFDDEMQEEEEPPDLPMREYQKELAENALKGRNTIICAPTGSGKTRVATHIILNHLKEKQGEPTCKIAFMARTVPLVMQQYKSLKKFLPRKYEVTYLTGDSEHSMHLHMMLHDNHVIVLTPRILENHLKRNCLPNLGVFSMMIFDECHHTRKGEPYNTLMYSYLRTKKKNKEVKLPQIIGLTASVGVEKAVQDDEAIKYILQVCGNLDVESISCVVKNEAELKEKVPVPEEIMKKLHERDDDDAVKQIKKLMAKLENCATRHGAEINKSELNNLLQKIPSDRKSQQYGQWAVQLRHITRAVPREEHRETNIPVRCLMILSDYLVAYNAALELYDLVQLMDVMNYLRRCFAHYGMNDSGTKDEKMYFDDYQNLCKVLECGQNKENPNLNELGKTLQKYLVHKGENSCGIIFVRTRALTDAITSWLNRCGVEELKMLKATVFTGTAASEEQGGMTTAQQDEVIGKFKSGEIRLLVATSVGEEGLDIPECNLVIKYNHVGNEVSTVQTRGRSRKEGGRSVLLAMEKIILKERINQEKAKMMLRAITTIAQMTRSKIRKKNIIHQEQIMKEVEIHDIVKQQEQNRLKNIPFQMVCYQCRKVVIDSKDIKTIYGTHRVVVNRKILEQTKTIPFVRSKYVDEVKMIGNVYCLGEPMTKTRCKNKLGTMMVHSNVPFVVLGIKFFGFDTKGSHRLDYYNQWKKVPYAIEEINPLDFKRYLPEKGEKLKHSERDDSSYDEDSDGSNDDGNIGDMPLKEKDSAEKVEELPSTTQLHISNTGLRSQTGGSDHYEAHTTEPLESTSNQKQLHCDTKTDTFDSGFNNGNKRLLLPSSRNDKTAVKRQMSETLFYNQICSSDDACRKIQQRAKTVEELDQQITTCIDAASEFSKISSNEFQSKQSSQLSSMQMSDSDSNEESLSLASRKHVESDRSMAQGDEFPVAHHNENLQEDHFEHRNTISSSSMVSVGQIRAHEAEISCVSSDEQEPLSDGTIPKVLTSASEQARAAQNLNPVQDNNDANGSMSLLNLL